MILFSERMAIEKQFIAWCKENGVAEKPCSLVGFMQAKGWLNEEKIALDLIKEKNNGFYNISRMCK